MPQTTRGQLVALTRQYMDAVGATDRWSDDFIKTVLNGVYDEEWSNILNATPYYTFQQLQRSTDTNGQITIASLSTGTGDTQRDFYRILSVSDGNVLYDETAFQYVPLATTTNYLPTYPRLYYLAGDNVQILPVGASVSLYIAVNYKPTALLDLSSDTTVITFPNNNETLLAISAAYKLLHKGGAELQAANAYKRLSDDERQTMLDDLRRRTINPTRMGYPDQKYDWAGG